MTPVIAIWLLMAIPSKKGLATQFHWFKGLALVNINGGHSEGYIRNAGLGSVPKIAKLAYFLHTIFLVHQDKLYFAKGYFTFKAYRLVCFTFLIAFQVIKSQGGLRL